MDKTLLSIRPKKSTESPLTALEKESLDPKESNTSVELTLGSVLKNRFVLESELGRGGMGVVYKVRDLRKEEALDRNPYIALKVLGEEFKNNPDSFIALQRETKKCQELAHPNIVTVYDFDRDGEHVYMTMEFLDGQPLSALLSNDLSHTASLQERWDIIRQIGIALAYAHEKNIIHLDLKPGNIFVKKDGTVKVLDFGIARAAKNTDQTQTIDDATVFDAGSLGALTPSYASCEMLENEDPEFRDDIYSFACVAYEVLSGRHPFNRIPATHARFNNMYVEAIDEISKKQHRALKRALKFKHEDRTPTVQQFLLEAQLLDVNPNEKIDFYWKWATSLLFLAMVVAGIYQMNTEPLTIPPQTAGNEQNAPQSVSKEEPIKKKTLTPREREKVQRILEAAEIHLLIGRRSEPRGANAMDAYSQVLQIDPGNQAAREGLQSIADYYEALALELWKKGDKESSKKYTERGLLAYPKDKELLQLKKKIGK